ncbi:MAG: ABC transporter ATP-binding protein [Saprospiraceae bacterium]|nr:ABC transporter ATP-binding protein [Saprospiraceae bacterium]
MQDIQKLVQYLLKYKSKVILSIFCHILMAVFTVISIPLIIPFFQLLFNTTSETVASPDSVFDVVNYLKYIFTQVIDNQGTDRALLLVCLLVVITFLLKNVFRYLAMFFMVSVRSNIVRDLRKGLYQHYLSLSISSLKNSQRGDLISRLTGDVQEVEWSMLRFIDAIFKSPLIIIGSIFFMLSINARLTLFVFVLMLFTALVIGTLSKTLKKQSLVLQNLLASLTSTVDETLDGAVPLRVFRVQKKWAERFKKVNEAFRHTLNKVTWRQDMSSPLSEFLGVSLVVVLLWYGSKLVLQGDMASEDFFAFIFAFYNVIEPSKSFATAYYNVRRGSAALQRIDDQIQSEILEENAGEKAFKFEQKIKVEDLSFKYENDWVLRDVSFQLNKGETLAIVGASGSGKTTLMNLLLKLIAPQEGRILIDNIPLDDIDKNEYYSHIGLVTQTPFLYNDSIRNNITLGREPISDETINNALELANASAFLQNLEGKLDYNVGDRGEQLSGGEKQRITIARALLEDPDILILDEPTSALDPKSEQKVSMAIINALQDRTAIIIAHKLATIKYADRIIVLDNGRIVEEGRHDDLIAQEGQYAAYVKIQSV